jgi:hypothetical protein
MARKKSIKASAKGFKDRADDAVAFLAATDNLGDEHISWCHDYAVIRLYRAFEDLVLECLVGALNNDTATISQRTGYNFPQHLTDEICEYLVVGTGYFDFRGRDGLISELKNFLPDQHYVVDSIKKQKYKAAIEQLCALRNLAAHNSDKAKRAALSALGQERLSSPGAWLKRQGRFGEIVNKLKELADEIHAAAPY